MTKALRSQMKTIKEQSEKQKKISNAKTATERRRAAATAAAGAGRLAVTRPGKQSAQLFKSLIPKGGTARQAAEGAAGAVAKGQKRKNDPLYNKKQMVIKEIESFNLPISDKNKAKKVIMSKTKEINIQRVINYWKYKQK